jgi:hypothetical protein
MSDQDKLDTLIAQKAQDRQITKQEKADISNQLRKLKDVNVTLAYARTAVKFVLEQVKNVANWDERLLWSAESIWTVGYDNAEARYNLEMSNAKSADDVRRAQANRAAALAKAKADSEKAWNTADQQVYGKLRQEAEWQRINAQRGGVQDVDDIRILSDLADKYDSGNCGEMTAMAFMYLYNLGVRPLDFMALVNPADHAFVVIGRKNSPDHDSYGRNWNKDAVVCDPWAYGLYKALPPGVPGGAKNFGEPYSAYEAKFLEQKMREMHAGFSGVSVTVSV